MSTQPIPAPAADEKPKAESTQKTFFDLDSFSDVTLKKVFTPAQPVKTVQEAEVRLGNDTKRLLEIINEGLIAEQRRQVQGDPAGWHLMDDDGELNGEFSGTPADPKKFNAFVLNLQKFSVAPSMGINWDGATKEQKDAIRTATLTFIKDTPMLRNSLKKSVALKLEEVDAE